MPNIQPGRHIRMTSFPAFRHSRMRSWPKSIRIRAPDHVPQPLVDQLAVGGRMIIPVGVAYQEILLVSRTPTGILQQRTIPVRFVPLVRPPR